MGSSEFRPLGETRGNISGPDRFRIFLAAPWDVLFTNRVSLPSLSRPCCPADSNQGLTQGLSVNTTRESLPGTGISQIIGFVLGSLSFLRLQDPFDANFTMYHDGLTRDISLATTVWGNDIAMATTPAGPVADRLTLASSEYQRVTGHVALIEISGWRQPFLSVSCAAPDPTTLKTTFGPGMFSPSPFQVKLDNGKSMQGRDGIGFIDLDQYLPENIHVSAAFMSRYAIADQKPGSNSSERSHILCLVGARWVESDLSFDRSSSVVRTSVQASPPADHFNRSEAWDSYITLEQPWLDSLNADLGESFPYMYYSETPTPSRNRTVFSAFQAVCNGTRPNCLATLLAMYLSDALARRPYIYGIYPGRMFEDSKGWAYNPDLEGRLDLDLSNLSDYGHHTLPGWKTVPDAFTGINYSLYRLVYYFSFQGTPIYLAFTVLWLHLALVAVHCLVALYITPFHSGAWSQLGELLALALGSSPTGSTGRGVQNTGGGVGRTKTWQLASFIRETQANNKLELVLWDGDQEDGMERGEKSACLTKPELDCSYA